MANKAVSAFCFPFTLSFLCPIVSLRTNDYKSWFLKLIQVIMDTTYLSSPSLSWPCTMAEVDWSWSQPLLVPFPFAEVGKVGDSDTSQASEKKGSRLQGFWERLLCWGSCCLFFLWPLFHLDGMPGTAAARRISSWRVKPIHQRQQSRKRKEPCVARGFLSPCSKQSAITLSAGFLFELICFFTF